MLYLLKSKSCRCLLEKTRNINKFNLICRVGWVLGFFVVWGGGDGLSCRWAVLVPDCIVLLIDFHMIHGRRPVDTCFHTDKNALST